MIQIIRALIITALSLSAFAAQAAEGNVGIVLLHGKWDRQPTSVMKLAGQLEDAGYKVATPMMPWSFLRQYDAPYPQALVEIETAAQSLRDRDHVSRIVIEGQSIGANAALAYAASGRPVDAIVALAPGHLPQSNVFRKRLESSVTKAKEMIASGAGSETAGFDDLNQGQLRNVRTSAQSYFSYLDPEGLGNMPKTAAAIATPLPIFMAVGTGDPLAPVAEESIFNRAPKHGKSVYMSVPGGHMETQSASGSALVDWLRSLGF
jgi:dienelactone hydrolase